MVVSTLFLSASPRASPGPRPNDTRSHPCRGLGNTRWRGTARYGATTHWPVVILRARLTSIGTAPNHHVQLIKETNGRQVELVGASKDAIAFLGLTADSRWEGAWERGAADKRPSAGCRGLWPCSPGKGEAFVGRRTLLRTNCEGMQLAIGRPGCPLFPVQISGYAAQ